MTTTEETAKLLEAHARTDNMFVAFTHYNTHYQIRFEIPAHFLTLKTPQWSHISSIERLDPNRFDSSYMVTVVIFESELFYLDAALRHSFLTITA